MCYGLFPKMGFTIVLQRHLDTGQTKYVLNVDGNLAPLAKSVAGKAELRPKLRDAIEAAALGLTTRLKGTSPSLANLI